MVLSLPRTVMTIIVVCCGGGFGALCALRVRWFSYGLLLVRGLFFLLVS